MATDGFVTELGGRALQTTNNRMELTAAIEALEHVREVTGGVEIYTDSTYLIKGIGEWIRSWRRNGWTTREGGAVLNRELWQRLDDLVAAARLRGRVAWHYVRGHSGIPGNERVDAIADQFARGAAVELYVGPLGGYAVAVFDVPADTTVPPRSARAGARTPNRAPHSYLSLVDGQLMRHRTWPECEARVKGRSGARFKKAANHDEEIAVLRAWGVPPEAW